MNMPPACLTAEDLQPCVHIDAELPTEEISFELVGELQTLGAYGAGNPRPVFLARNLCIVSEPRLIGQRHLKLCCCWAERPSAGNDLVEWSGADAEW